MSNLLDLNNYTYQSWTERFPDYKVDLKSLPVDDSWKEFMEQEYEKPYFDKLEKFLSHCLTKTQGKINIFPYPDLLFNALNTVKLENVTTTILGQDPYFKKELYKGKSYPQAMGLSFSVPIGVKIPSSLSNIYKNLKANKHITNQPTHGNLSLWASQGCLLLNTSLTVQEGYPNSHEKFWVEFTDNLIKYISDKHESIVFVLWGAPSLKKRTLIDPEKHTVLVSSHPSGLSCNNTLSDPILKIKHNSFNTSDHFGEINKHLKNIGKPEIDWNLDY